MKSFIKPICIIFLLLLFVSACNQPSISIETLYRVNKTLLVDGLTRTYTVNLPPNYLQSNQFSVVIALHGGGGDALQFESTSKLTEKADASGFIVVYPEGVKSTGPLGARSWNAGNCCDYASANNIDDVKFIGRLIDKLIASYKINPKKVYVTGHSNGGMMAYRLACELSGEVAAIAPNASTMVVSQPCHPTRAMPILHMHSALDTKVPYRGGIGTGPGTEGVFMPSINSVLRTWSQKNLCQTLAQVIINNSKYKFTKWSNCTNNVTLDYYLTKDGGHGWPGGLPGGPFSDTPSTAIHANDLLWEFFQKHQLP
jgi:polyhydroxybutyrate depolymerase